MKRFRITIEVEASSSAKAKSVASQILRFSPDEWIAYPVCQNCDKDSTKCECNLYARLGRYV